MRHFLRYLICGELIAVLPVLAQVQVQSPSCYTTTTVVFGNPQPILSSLSMVSNFTIAVASTAISISASFVATTSPTASGLTELFRITVNVPAPARLRARSIEYVSFSGSDGILVMNSAEATLFQLVNNYLMTSTGQHVGASTNGGYTQLRVFSSPPANAQWTADSDGTLNLSDDPDVCYTPDGTLVISFNELPPFNCTKTSLMVAVTSASTSISVPVGLPSSTIASTSAFGASPHESSLEISPSSELSASFVPMLTSTSGSASMVPSSSGVQHGTGTASSAVSSSLYADVSSSSSSLPQSIPPMSSSSASAMFSNPTSILGPGQLSTQISSIFSLPIVVSSISSSMPVSSSPPVVHTISSSVSSSRASTSSVESSSSRTASSTASASSSPASSSSTSFVSRSSSISSVSTNTIFSSPTLTTSSIFFISSLSALPSPYQRNTGKRGLAYTKVTLTQLYSLQGQNSKVSWAYDYYSLPNASNNIGLVNPALNFIPLLYNNAPSLTSLWSSNVQYSIQHYGTDALFSFNEPDACNNGESACMSVNASVTGYQTYMQPFAGQVLLGAPSVTNGAPPASLTYLSYFLGNCTGCTIDFINLHWYSSPYSFSYLTSYIQQAYQVGGQRPIYLTEIGMDSVYYAEADVATFLKNATTWLDSQSYVHRYAWFGDFAQSGPAYEQGFGYLVNASGNALSNEGVIFNNYTGGYVPCPLSSGC